MKKFLLIALVFALSSFGYAKNLQFSGYSSYKRFGGQIRIKADTVRNNSYYKSGTLKITLWATRYKYRGGTINGYIVGSTKLGRLRGNRYFRNISRRTSFRAPPRGRYYMTMTLSEYKNGRYKIVDYIKFSRRERF